MSALFLVYVSLTEFNCYINKLCFHADIHRRPKGKSRYRSQQGHIGKELKTGSTVAVNHPSWVGTIPQIAQVVSVPYEPFLDTKVEIKWFDEERAPHKPRRRQRYTQSTKYANSYVTLRNILLYDIELNRSGKGTRNELEKLYSDLKDGD